MSVHYKPEGFRQNTKYGLKWGDEYSTPPKTFRFFHEWMIDCGHRGFNRDPCSSKANHKTPVFCTKRDNRLRCDAGESINFMNPPFSKKCGGTGAWTGWAVDVCRRGATVGALLPVWGFGDAWAVDHVEPYASEILFVEGRIKFIAPPGRPGLPDLGATFSTAFVLWLPGLRPIGTDIRTSWIKCPLR